MTPSDFASFVRAAVIGGESLISASVAAFAFLALCGGRRRCDAGEVDRALRKRELQLPLGDRVRARWLP